MDTRRKKRKPSLDPIEDSFPSSTQGIRKRLKQKLKLKPAESSPPFEFADIQFAQPQEPTSSLEDDYVPLPLPPLEEKEKAPKPAAVPIKAAAPIPALPLERTLSSPVQFKYANSQTSQEHFQLPDGDECAQDPYKDLSPLGAPSGSKRI